MSCRLLCIAACIVAAAPAARADDTETEITRRPLTLRRGAAEVGMDLEVSISVRETGEPISLAPDVRYGITRKLTVGLTHSFRSQSLLGVGNGLCLTGALAGCPDRYAGTSLELMYLAAPSGNVDSALRGRLTARDYDPFKPTLALGFLARHRQGRFATVVDPYVSFGLANTELGNAAFVNVPVWLQVQATRSILPYARTGIEGVYHGFGDTYRVPFGAGVVYARGPFDVGLELAMSSLLGPQNDVKPRAMRVWLTWRPATARRRPPAGS